jgi:tRNA A-37 threonylcarbamoyl transferase component Bud32
MSAANSIMAPPNIGEELKQQLVLSKSKLNTEILDFCRHIAGSTKITAIANVDNYSSATVNETPTIQIMLIISNFQPRIMSYIKRANGKPVFIYAIDKRIFERDINMSLLGEAIAGKLIFPYTALHGQDYLHKREVALKKRLVMELLENLVLNFPELAHTMQIKPQYFLYEVLLNRTRVFPLLAYDLSTLVKMLSTDENRALSSYNEALAELEAEGSVYSANGYFMLSKKLILRCQDPKVRRANLTKNAPRTIFSSFFGILPQLLNIISYNTEAFLKTQKINWKLQPEANRVLIEPQKYVFFPTSSGLISLSEKIDIKGFARKMLNNNYEDMEVEPIGGMLNDVYLIRTHTNGVESKLLAKRFKDWSGLKWYPLAVVSLNARPFVVPGQGRLAKECAINELLRSGGFNVPKILHVSNPQRLILMEYIDGENLTQAIKRIAVRADWTTFEKELAQLNKAGEIFAQVHAHNITLGDTKPENMLVKKDDTIYLIDFEQATRGGDKSWDVAVFLYFSGHFIQPSNDGIGKAECIAQTFINGYLKAGGNPVVIKKAALSKYTRVFRIYTAWSIISAISNVCKKTEIPK